jgi:hypothetical protein
MCKLSHCIRSIACADIPTSGCRSALVAVCSAQAATTQQQVPTMASFIVGPPRLQVLKRSLATPKLLAAVTEKAPRTVKKAVLGQERTMAQALALDRSTSKKSRMKVFPYMDWIGHQTVGISQVRTRRGRLLYGALNECSAVH